MLEQGSGFIQREDYRMLKTTEFLKYVFSEEELRQFAKELARQSTMAAEAQEEKKAVVAQYSERIASCQTNISKLSRFINNGYEHRNIDCSVLFHAPTQGSKTITRVDTGEIVKIVAMSQDELQETLAFEPTAE